MTGHCSTSRHGPKMHNDPDGPEIVSAALAMLQEGAALRLGPRRPRQVFWIAVSIRTYGRGRSLERDYGPSR